MDELFNIAIMEMRDLHHPYVGTEHLFLAYLEKYKNDYIDSYSFKKDLIDIIGMSSKDSLYVLFTPKLRCIYDDKVSIKEAILNILRDNDSIAYNVLLSKKYNIDGIYNCVLNSVL